MIEQIIIGIIIIVTVTLLAWGKWRYDIIALFALFSVALLGLISFEEMFLGFVHPVVVLIIAMLIISKALINSGVVDIVSRYLKIKKAHPLLQLAILTIFTAFISAFVNSMGALAFIIPIAIRMARQNNVPASTFLLPVAFASHFGGGITLIGSVSNIIVSGFRAEEALPFAFFDFAFVAIPISVVSIIFITLVGWRLVPQRENVACEANSLKRYITEVKIPENSLIEGKTIEEFRIFSKEYFALLSIIRNGNYIPDPSPFIVLQKGDVLVMEAETDCLESIITTGKLELIHKKPFEEYDGQIKNIEVIETVVSGFSPITGETAKDLELHNNYRINILAIHRPGKETKKRISETRLRRGDILIVQGHRENISRFMKVFNLLPLQEREINFDGKTEKAALAITIFILAIVISVLGLMPVHIIFFIAAVLLIAMGMIAPKDMYRSFDFSMIVVVAVMLQLGFVFQQTGAASSLASSLFLLSDSISPVIALSILFIFSIWLSDILSNVTVAALLAPVAFSMALQLGVSPDPFFMAVAIGSGSSYLTPIGHQSNIFVMNIGNYKFGDYWKLGLPLEIITFVIGLPLILYFWPF